MVLEEISDLIKDGNIAQAEARCRQILQTNQQCHEAWFQLGVIAAGIGKTDVALQMVGNAAQIQPSSFLYHRSLGELYRRLGRYEQAVGHTEIATILSPKDAESFYNFGLALADSGHLDKAADAYRQALANDPRHNLAANNLGTCLEKLGDEEGAIKAYRKAVSIEPKHAEAYNNLGAILSARGDLEKAKTSFSKAIKADPMFVHAHYNLSSLKKYKEDDPHIQALENILKNAERLPPDMRLRFWFAIGKAYEDTKRYDEAFTAYQKGNSLKRQTIQYDVSATEAVCADIIKGFNKAFADKKTGDGCTDETPVFIVGMPRSGTTLIEQILSSHSKVYGAGELKDFSDALGEIRDSGAEDSYINWLLQTKPESLAKLGENYVERIRTKDKKALRITDKMPGNFFFVGLIHKALPKAKIIHVIRDPMDICVSNYSRLFNETMPFAYNLEDLGRYYNVYRDLMAHWHDVLPEGTILDVRYEDVVDNLEEQAQRLIAYCDLEWEESCLAFHRNKRHVQTASIAQVRQPIYKNSVARWERFQSHLGSLKKILKQK